MSIAIDDTFAAISLVYSSMRSGFGVRAFDIATNGPGVKASITCI